jgi:hypothetical protein
LVRELSILPVVSVWVNRISTVVRIGA